MWNVSRTISSRRKSSSSLNKSGQIGSQNLTDKYFPTSVPLDSIGFVIVHKLNNGAIVYWRKLICFLPQNNTQNTEEAIRKRVTFLKNIEYHCPSFLIHFNYQIFTKCHIQVIILLSTTLDTYLISFSFLTMWKYNSSFLSTE